MIRRGLAFITMAAIGTIATASMAAPQVLVTDDNIWDHQGSGGPYAVQPTDFGFTPGGIGLYGADANSFVTFSLLVEPKLNVGESYDVELSRNTSDGDGGERQIDPRTAFLYTVFLNGTLDDQMVKYGGSSFTYDNGKSARNLQDAIWFIEGKLDHVEGQAGAIVTMANNQVRLSDGDWFGQGLGDIRVMNLTGGQYRDGGQQALVMIPLPLPAAMALAGLAGVGGVSALRRKFSGKPEDLEQDEMEEATA